MQEICEFKHTLTHTIKLDTQTDRHTDTSEFPYTLNNWKWM